MNNTENININNVSIKSRISCFVCGKLLNDGDQSLSNMQTAIYSGTDVNELLENILGENLVNLRESEFRVWCSSCIKIIDSYDEAIVTAKQREQELLELFYGKIGKFETITLTPNVHVQIKDEPIDILSEHNIIIYQSEESAEDDNIAKNEMEESTTKDDNIAKNEPEESTENDNIILNDPGKSTKEDYSFKNVDTNESASKNGFTKIKPKRKAKIYKESVSKCDQCGKMFDKYYIKSHRRTHMPPAYICNICKTPFKSASVLKIHIGLHNGFSPYVCKICDKKFTQSSILRRHMALHTGECLYQCEKCGIQFSHSSSYRHHKWTHENRICKCTICEKEMKNPDILYKHMLIHNEKSHKCPTCGKKFHRSANMREHIKAVHEVIHRVSRFKCNICDQSFPRPSKLKEHMAQTHNAVVVTHPSELDASGEGEFVVTSDK